MTLNASYSTTTPAFRLTDAPTTGVALPATDPSQYGNRPLVAYLQAVTANIRYTSDGSTPTSSHGMVLVAGNDPFYYYAGPLNNLRFIQASSGAVLNVEYSQSPIAQGAQGIPGQQGSPGGAVPYVLIDLETTVVPPTGAIVIPTPGANAFLVPDQFTVIGADNSQGMDFGWASNEAIINFDADTGFNFTGGRFTFMSKAATQAITSVNPIGNPFKMFLSRGRVGLTSIKAAGSGYVVGDTVKDPFNGTFLATVTQIGAAGAVTGYTVTAIGDENDYLPGEDDLVMLNTAPQSGAGSGFTLQVDSLRGGPGILKITYDVISP